jgi:hypothetical protein
VATSEDAYAAILEAITESAKLASPAQLLALAEALAWLMHPNQPHGGGIRET